MVTKKKDAPPLAFEEAQAKLEQCIEQLEDGQIGLEQALAHYEEGVGLLAQCYGLLQQAEQRIQVLSGVDEKGQPVTRPMVSEVDP